MHFKINVKIKLKQLYTGSTLQAVVVNGVPSSPKNVDEIEAEG